MELELTQGCVCDSLTIDNIEEVDLTDEQRIEVLNKIGEYIKTVPTDTLNDFLQDFIQLFGEFEDIGHCEQCGDDIWKFKIII